MSYLECYITTRLNSEHSFSHTDLGRLIYFLPKGLCSDDLAMHLAHSAPELVFHCGPPLQRATIKGTPCPIDGSLPEDRPPSLLASLEGKSKQQRPRKILCWSTRSKRQRPLLNQKRAFVVCTILLYVHMYAHITCDHGTWFNAILSMTCMTCMTCIDRIQEPLFLGQQRWRMKKHLKKIKRLDLTLLRRGCLLCVSYGTNIHVGVSKAVGETV